MQEMKVRTESEILVAKNLEVETAVEDLISELARYPIEGALDTESINQLRIHYNKMLYTALLNCVKNSLNKMKARVCVRGGGRGFGPKAAFCRRRSLSVFLLIGSIR